MRVSVVFPVVFRFAVVFEDDRHAPVFARSAEDADDEDEEDERAEADGDALAHELASEDEESEGDEGKAGRRERPGDVTGKGAHDGDDGEHDDGDEEEDVGEVDLAGGNVGEHHCALAGASGCVYGSPTHPPVQHEAMSH